MNIIKQRAHARVGLIGNPSDGYGGRTISFALANFSAQVVMYPWEEVEILWSRQDKNRFASVDELVSDVNLNGYYGGVRLVKATIKRFVEFCRAQDEAEFRLHEQPFSIRYETNIPRGVGLSGSSAIVVATIRCLERFYGVTLPLPLRASLARSVENDELGIACGYQDRVAQVYGGLVSMDFSQLHAERGLQQGIYRRLDADLLPPMYLAYDLGAAKTSSSVHGPLRTRLRDNPALQSTMHEIAGLVPLFEDALAAGDVDRMNALLDRNFDLRSTLYHIHPQHRLMIDTARRLGVSAKFAGSGGAIVGICLQENLLQALRNEFARINVEWLVVKPIIARREGSDAD